MKVHPSVILFILFSATWLQAGLVFESREVELQAELGDKSAEAVFKFTNEGDTRITIRRVRSSCGCTVPELDKEVYAPGESGEIRARFTFGSRTGKQQKRVTVETNESGMKTYSLKLVTEIPKWGNFQPQLQRWSLNSDPAPKKFQLEILNPGKVSLAGQNIELEHFIVEETVLESGLREYSVTPKSTVKRVTERFEITLKTGEGDSVISRQLVVYCLIR